MKEKGKATLSGGKKTCNNYYKSRHYYTALEIIRRTFCKGGKFTAVQLNRLAKSNDSRKCISVLRKEGMPICDHRLSNGCKEYFLSINPTTKGGNYE